MHKHTHALCKNVLCFVINNTKRTFGNIWDVILFSSLPLSVPQWWMCHVCISLSVYISSFITSASQHRPAVPSGASCRPLSFSNNITGHSARAPAGSEIIMAVKQSRFQRLRVPASRFPGHRLRLHLRSSQPWPTFPASFAEYSFCSVQVVAGGGGWVVRSSYALRGRSVQREILSRGANALKRMDVFRSPILHLQR